MKPFSIENLAPLLLECRRMLESGQDVETILHFLRAQDCSVIESAKILIALEGVSLQEAKQILHLSETWSDKRQEFETLHKQMEQSFNSEGGDA